MAHVDVYMPLQGVFRSYALHRYAFLCPNCGGNSNPATTMSNIVNTLKNQQVNFGELYVFTNPCPTESWSSWLDIENCNGCWSSASTNANYIAQVLSWRC
jgi:hypothetical protein